MKIVLDLKEVERVLADYLIEKSVVVKPNSFDRISHFEVDYSV